MSKLLPLCIVLLAASTAVSAQTYTVIHNFGNVSGDPGPNFFGRIAQSRGGAMLTTTRDAIKTIVGQGVQDMDRRYPSGPASI